MIIYEDFRTTDEGVKLVRAYSDEGYSLERDGVIYDEAIDPESENRKYTEIDTSTEEASIEDYETALQEIGVEL